MKRVNNIIRAIKLTWKCDKKFIFIKVFMMIMNIAFSFTSIYIKKELIDALTVNKSTFGVLLRLLLISTAIDVLQLLINIFKKPLLSENKYASFLSIAGNADRSGGQCKIQQI